MRQSPGGKKPDNQQPGPRVELPSPRHHPRAPRSACPIRGQAERRWNAADYRWPHNEPPVVGLYLPTTAAARAANAKAFPASSAFATRVQPSAETYEDSENNQCFHPKTFR